MTAVLHSVELLIPGTIQSATESEEYRVPHRPAPVTGDVRRRLVADINCEQRMWFLCVISAGLLLGLMFAYSARERGIPLEVQQDALRSVFIAGFFLLGYLHLHYRRQRRFIQNAPATLAHVIAERNLPDESDSISTGLPRLAVYYTPDPPMGSTEEYSMLDGPCAPVTWADLEGFTGTLGRALQPGDLVAVLYDPANPTHIRLLDV